MKIAKIRAKPALEAIHFESSLYRGHKGARIFVGGTAPLAPLEPPLPVCDTDVQALYDYEGSRTGPRVCPRPRRHKYRRFSLGKSSNGNFTK